MAIDKVGTDSFILPPEGQSDNALFDIVSDNDSLFDIAEQPTSEEMKLPNSVALDVIDMYKELTGQEITLSTQKDLDNLITGIDTQEYKKTADFIDAVSLSMAESGQFDVKSVIDYRNESYKKHPKAYGAGMYTALVDKRLQSMADNPITLNNMIDEDPAVQLANKMISYTTNMEMIKNKVTESSQAYFAQPWYVSAAKGISATLPGESVLSASFGYNKIKDLLGISMTGTKNELFTKAHDAIAKKAMELNADEFKKLLEDIDSQFNNATATLGERQEFWDNVIDLKENANTFETVADIVGLLPPAYIAGASTSKVAAMAEKAGAKLSKLDTAKIASKALVSELIPGGGITLATLENTLEKPVKKLLWLGQKKAAAMLESELATKIKTLEAGLEQGANVGEALLKTGRDVIESRLTALGSTTKKIPQTTDGSWLRKLTDAVMKVADDFGLNPEQILSANKLARELSQAATILAVRDGAKNGLNQHVVEALRKALGKDDNLLSTVSTRIVNGKYLETSALIGSGTGKHVGFATEEEARAMMKNIKIKNDMYYGNKAHVHNKVVMDRGQYFIETTTRYLSKEGEGMTLADLVKARLQDKLHPLGKKEWGAIGKDIFSRLTTPEFNKTFNNALQSAEGQIQTTLAPVVSKVKKGDGPILRMLMDKTVEQEAWISNKTLKEIGVPDKTIEAYNSLRLLEDTEFLLRGRDIVKRLEELGMKNVMYKGQRLGLGKAVENYDKSTVKAVTLANENEYKLVDIDWDKSAKQDYQIFKMQSAVEDTNFIAIPKLDMSVSNPGWSNTLMSYKPGRAGFSKGTGFIKQTNMGTNAKGEKYFRGISTIYAHFDANQVSEVAPVLEQMRQVAIKFHDNKLDRLSAQKAFEAIPNREKVRYTSFDDFYKVCGDDKKALISLDKDSPLQFARDGEQIKVPEGFSAEDYNFQGASYVQFTNSERKMNALKRGDSEIFNPFRIGEAPRQDIQEELDRAVEDIIRYSNSNEYRDMMAEDYFSTFKKYLPDSAKNMSPVQILTSDDIIKHSTAPDKVKNQMLNAKHNYERMISTPSNFDKWLEQRMKDVASAIHFDWTKETGFGVREKAFKAINNLSPLKQARAIAFHMMLGLYNPRQLWAQALASANVAAISPVAFAKVFPMQASGMLFSYTMSGEKSLAAKICKTFNVSPEYLEDLVEGAKRLDIYSKGYLGGAIEKRGIKDFLSAKNDTIFFDMGESMNRMNAAYVTVQEALSKGVKIKDLSAEEILPWLNRQQNLYMNMGRAGSAEIQRNALALVTQFRGYGMRAIESYADRTLSLGERGRLFAMNLTLAGTKGFIGGNFGSMLYNGMTSMGFNRQIAETVYLGALDELIKENGGDYSLGDFFGANASSLLEIAMGDNLLNNAPAVSAIKQGVGAVTGLVLGLSKFGKAQMDGEDYSGFLDVVKDLALQKKLPPFINNTMSAAFIIETGKRINSKGDLLDKDLTKVDAVMTALGFKHIKDDLSYVMMQELSKRKQSITETVNEARFIRSMMINGPESDRDKYGKLFHGYLSTLKDLDASLANDIIKEVFSPTEIKRLTVPQIQSLIMTMTKVTKTNDFVTMLKRELEQRKETLK